MQIRLLKKGYMNNKEFYQDFLDGKIAENEEYFDKGTVSIDSAPDFPIYLGKLHGKSEEYKRGLWHEAFDTITKYYLDIDREFHLEGLFWDSLLCVHKRDFLLETYPEIKESMENFKNIVIKKFDWENYIYKLVLGAEYIKDNVEEDREKYYDAIINNLDVYNYIIKYEIFRNDKFLLNILDIIEDNDLSTVMKAKIKGRDDLGKDERVGRRVIFEFNKSYPVIMSPMLEKEELEELFFRYLGYYNDIKLSPELV